MTPTLLEFNHKRLTNIRTQIIEGTILVSIFRQEYPDIVEFGKAYWDMDDLYKSLGVILLKMEQRMGSEE